MPTQLKSSRIRKLYPEITPYSSGFLEVSDIHTLYWEICGNPDGVPVLVLHGGPGAGATAMHRRFFDPDFYKIILFDQRGAGRSTPLGELKDNNTETLISDIEKLRKHLRISKWHLFGGSWGTTLALAYAHAHKNTILSMTLRSIFLCEQFEVDWFLSGIRNIFPENWERFAQLFPDKTGLSLLKAYYKALTSKDDEKARAAGISWALYESGCMSFYPRREVLSRDDDIETAVAMSKIEAHYFLTQMRDTKNSLLNNIEKFKQIPCTIIQGRYDMICPVISAEKLHQAWPEADYIIVPDGGHSALDPTICSRLIEAMENAKLLTSKH